MMVDADLELVRGHQPLSGDARRSRWRRRRRSPSPPSRPTRSGSWWRSGPACCRSSRPASCRSSPATCRWSRACRRPRSRRASAATWPRCCVASSASSPASPSCSPPSGRPRRASGTLLLDHQRDLDIAAGVVIVVLGLWLAGVGHAPPLPAGAPIPPPPLPARGLGPPGDGHGLRLRLDARASGPSSAACSGWPPPGPP